MPFTFKAASEQGSYTTCARTIQSPHSLPAWISLFYSVTPPQSGISGETIEFIVDPSTMFSFLDFLTDYGFSIEIQSERVDLLNRVLFSTRGVKSFNWMHDDMSSHACMETYLQQTESRAFVFHFTSAERIAHVHGYDSHEYRDQLRCIDWQIKEISKCVWRYNPFRTTFFLISNHGGSGYEHDHFDRRTLDVPIAAWGYGISHLGDISPLVSMIDTIQFAPTIAALLEKEVPSQWKYPPIPYIINGSSASCNIISTFHGNINRELEKLEFCPLPAGSLKKNADKVNVVMLIVSCIIYITVFYSLKNLHI